MESWFSFTLMEVFFVILANAEEFSLGINLLSPKEYLPGGIYLVNKSLCFIIYTL